MSEETKPADADKPTEEKKDAEGQATWQFFCSKCGNRFYSQYYYSAQCPRCGSTDVRSC